MTRSLLTGGAGFIGSHLAEHLLREGEEVVVLDNLTTGRFENIRHLVNHGRFHYYVGDVEDAPLLSEAGHGCGVLYHLAAAVGVDLIMNDPVRTIETNINGTEAVLKYAVRYGKKVLITSTSEVYGKATKLPFSEEDDVVYGPTSRRRWAYAISKAVDEFLLRAYAESKGLPGVTVRLFNTVGPRQVGHYGMVIPRFVKQALNGGPITVYGDGTQTRCFGHVLDIVPALHQLVCGNHLLGDVINLGGTERISINELAQTVQRLIGGSVDIIHRPYSEAYQVGFEDMKDRQPDLTRATEQLAFKPKRNLQNILEDVLADLRGCWQPAPIAEQ